MGRTIPRRASIWVAAAAMLCGAALSFAQDGSWVTKAPMPTPRVGSAAAVLGGSLYVVGGGNSTWPSLSEVESYDPETDAWATRSSIPVSMNGAGAGAIGGILFVVGGGTTNSNGGGQILGTLQAYNLRDPQPSAGGPARCRHTL